MSNIKKVIVFFTILIIFTFSFSNGIQTKANTEDNDAPYLNVYYFHNNPCDACHEDVKFMNEFNSLVGGESNGVNFNVYVEDIFKQGSSDLFTYLCNEYHVPESQRNVPAIFIGSTYIQGNTGIQSRLKTAFEKAKEDFLKEHPDATGNAKNTGSVITSDSGGSSASDSVSALKGAKGTDTHIVLFYVTACEDCDKIKAMLGKLKSDYTIKENRSIIHTKLIVDEYNVGEMQNLNLARQYFAAYQLPDSDQKVPLLFIGNKYFAGGSTNASALEKVIQSGEGTHTPLPEGKDSVQNNNINLKKYNFAGIFLTGLINGLNPCSISMLLFLFSLLLAKSANVLKYGLSFLVGKFLTYIALGTIAYNLFLLVNENWLQNLQNIVKIILLVVVCIFAAVNIWDFFSAYREDYGKIKLQLPAALRKANHRWIQKLSSKNAKLLLPMCFVLGVVISVGEFLCTGQIFLATLLYVMKTDQGFNLQAFSCFILYVLAMMIPLLVISIAIQKSKKLFEISEVIRMRMPLIKLINAVVFLIFAIVIFILF